MRRIVSIALTIATASSAGAQQTMQPPASPTIGASGGFSGGIAMPIGKLTRTNAAGYSLSGLVDFSAADQPFSFRLELNYQRFDKKPSVAGAANMNLTSLGGSILARRPKGASSAFLQGGIAMYKASGAGTKPGISVGGGLEVPLTFFVGIADLRIHYVLADRPIVTIPITLGARF